MKKLISSLFVSLLWNILLTLPVEAITVWLWWFGNQNSSSIWVAWAETGSTWNTGFLTFIETALNWFLWFLAFITIIILIYGWFLMVTAAWDDGKYKKWFTILKQTIIWLILIWVSALIINLIFNFVSTNTATSGGQ